MNVELLIEDIVKWIKKYCENSHIETLVIFI